MTSLPSRYFAQTECPLFIRTSARTRSAHWVYDLAGTQRAKALDDLSALPAYSRMQEVAESLNDAQICCNTVITLAMHGMAAPGAIAWATKHALNQADGITVIVPSLLAYPKLSSSLWSLRNKAMYTY